MILAGILVFERKGNRYANRIIGIFVFICCLHFSWGLIIDTNLADIFKFESGWFIDPKAVDVIKNKNFPPFAALYNGLEYELGYVSVEAIKDIWGFDVVVGLIPRRWILAGLPLLYRNHGNPSAQPATIHLREAYASMMEQR